MKTAAVLTACVGVALLVGASGTKTAVSEPPRNSFHFQVPTKQKKEQTCNKWKIVKGIRFYRASVWMWQFQQGIGYSRFTRWMPKHSCDFLNYLGRAARKKAKLARGEFEKWFSRTYAKWECIHNHEAAWNGDKNPTYDGGLQMDDSFEESYGSDFIRLWGHNASDWPVWAQLRTAERAYASRGFGPWPTRKYCGL